MKEKPKLTKEQYEDILYEVVPMELGVPCKFMKHGKFYNVRNGKISKNCRNLNFTKETALKVAKYTGTKAVFEKQE